MLPPILSLRTIEKLRYELSTLAIRQTTPNAQNSLILDREFTPRLSEHA